MNKNEMENNCGIQYYQQKGQQEEQIHETKKKGLELLREPFPEHQISKLPKPTKAQNECSANEKVNCQICGGWHHPKVIHLDYVGHAALTDRLLNADPLWYWEPLAYQDGLPAFDESGGLWIKLTICGHTRIGYGHAANSSYKEIGSREKEVIGDALRNAAMRFGAALDLWHKGDLHIEDEPIQKGTITPTTGAWDSLNDEERTFLNDIAIEVIDLIKSDDIKGAVICIENHKLDAEEKIALWTRFDSKQRSAMKKAAEEIKTKQ